MPISEAAAGSPGNGWSVRDGTGRFARLPPALRDDHFRVDELRFEQIVAMARDYAGLVVHHDLEGVATGPWTDLFSGSEVAVMATILAAPVDRWEKAHLAGVPLAPFATHADLLDLQKRWIRDLRGSQGPLGQQLRSVISELVSGAEEGYLASIQAMRIAQASARRLLPDALVDGSQDPASAVLLAFARLYGKVQERIGRFASRRTDFYYERILGESPRDGGPDRAELVLGVVVDRDVEIPAGTEFVANGDGEEIVYATEEAATLNGAKVQEVLTLHLSDERDLAEAAPGGTSGIWCGRLDGTSARPMFGAAREGGRAPDSRPARVGFLLADAVLLMREGLGKIEVTFECAWSSLEGTSLARSEGTDPPSQEEIEAFHKDFRNCLRVSYTGSTGWQDVAEYLPSCSLTDPRIPSNCLRLEMAIPAETHPLVAYSSEIHGESHGTSLPMLRFELNDQDAPHPYDLLSRLVVRRIEIGVKVHDCRNLTIHNQIGRLSPLSPFAPFGPLPAVGSHLLVGLAETRSKSLSSCRLHLRWDGLPDLAEGFREWYRDYGNPPSNDAFSVSVSVLADGRWLERPGGDVPVRHPLFRTEVDGGTLVGISQESEIDLEGILPGFKPMAASLYDQPLEYDPSVKGGFFRLSLDSPSGAFGHAEYPRLLTRTMMRNARLKSEKLASPMPNPPYTPILSSISMDYEAGSVIEVEECTGSVDSAFQSRLIHLHPFGWASPSWRSRSRVGLVPELGCRGNLYVGLRSLSPIRSLSLHFELQHDSIRSPEESPRWWVLDDEEWKELPPGAIKRDGTCGMSRSGIVQIELPEAKCATQTRMPPASLWLRIGVDRSPEHFCSVRSIRSQAIQVVRRGVGQGRGANVSLPPGSIASARRSLAGVEEVVQPCATHGGRHAEDREAFRIRMSERLRHKGRATDPQDFEKLVLERFPEVYKSKCFAHLEQILPVRPAPGRILFVPVPFPPGAGKGSLDATLNGSILAEIQEFLQGLCGGFARVSVANPAYERLQVHCRVRFRGDGSRGGLVDALDRAIRDWISPWTSVGNHSHFGWKIRRQELHAFLEGLDFVDRVDHFSLLRLVSRERHRYRLDDTGMLPERSVAGDEISPSVPWAVAIPMDRHLVGDSNALDSAPMADPTGLGELAIGSTFVIPSGVP